MVEHSPKIHASEEKANTTLGYNSATYADKLRREFDL